MVNQFHAHGIEVILDVVYNHTAEGNELGPTLSFKGIDNASYYRLLPDQKALLHQRHRHRQYGQSLASARPANGRGLTEMLGHGYARASVTLHNSTIAFNTAARDYIGTHHHAPGMSVEEDGYSLTVDMQSSILSNNTYGAIDDDFSTIASTDYTVT